MTRTSPGMREQQLPLHLKLPDQTAFDSFYPGPNREVLEYLCGVKRTMTWLWGKPSTGKTHLLQSVAAASDQSVYLPLSELDAYGPFVLEGYDAFDVVCIDALDTVIPAKRGDDAVDDEPPKASSESAIALSLSTQRQWEEVLFKLYQEVVVERGNTLVVASRMAPKNSQFLMADLHSRLLSGPVFRLRSLDDEQCLKAIQMRASRRGLKLPDATGQYLLKRMKRDMRSLCAFLDELDTASLVHQSKLTIPLVRTTLDQGDDDGHSAPEVQT